MVERLQKSGKTTDDTVTEIWAAPATLASPGRLAAGIEIDIVVGYGDAPANVPEAEGCAPAPARYCGS